jgi:hypothetical protein
MFRRVILVFVLMCSGCESSPLANEEASFSARVAETGKIAEGTLTTDSLTYRGSGGTYDSAAVLHFDKSMRVFRESADGSYVSSTRDQLAVGQKILVWTTGVEIRTLVPQYTALQILIRK